MKKTLLFLVLTLILSSIPSFGQNTTILTCDMPFTDPGGSNSNYFNNASQLYEVCPTSSDQYITVTFTSFALENNFDFLKVYLNGVLLQTYSGTAIPANISTTQPGQCLLFEFTSDTSVNAAGWNATITCSTTIPSTTVCFPPTSIAVTGVGSNPNGGTNATITMNGVGTATQWEYIAQLASVAAPTANSVGTPTTTNPFTVSGLAANNIYRFYVRTNCGNGLYSNWIASSTLTIGTPGTNCAIPTSIIATGDFNVATNSGMVTATVTGSNQNIQYIVLPQGTSPNSNTVGTPTTSSTITISNLASGQYVVYVRNDCGNGLLSSWTASNTVTLSAPIAPPTCGGLFFDNGGPTSNYNNNSDTTTTICPSNLGDVVSVSFLNFNTEVNWDALYVFNGNTITAPLFASSNGAANVPGGLAGGYWGTAIPGPFTSSAPDGCLTFRFRSDNSVNRAGWEANVICQPAPVCPAVYNISASNIGFTNATVNWVNNSSATQWEIITQLATDPAPTATSIGTFTTNNPFVITNLNPATTYRTYIRSVCNANESSLWSNVTFTTSSCGNQLQLALSQNTSQTSVTLTIFNTITSDNVIELLVQPSGVPAPTGTSAGMVVVSNSTTITGLTCGTAYTVYTRVSCNNGTTVGSWNSSLTFTTAQCTLSNGQANNMTQCNPNALNCFNLTDNDAPILAGLNPAEYTVAYYLTVDDANNQTNPLASPYCFNLGTISIIARLTNIANQQSQHFIFTITAQNTNPLVTLTPMSACDDNSDGEVVFNLTNQVTTTNTLAYYTSATDATAQTNPIVNPSAYTVGIATVTLTVFIRETMAEGCDNLYRIMLNINSNCSVSSTCINAYSLCGALGTPFNNTHQNIQAESGNNYGCLNSTPNPSWFYLPVSSNGTLNLTVQQNTAIDFSGQNLDVDYIVYGPFTDPVSPCTTPFTANQIVSCSFSGSSTEYPVIANAVAGQYYLIMTTNYSNQPGFIKISLNATSQGAIDCSGIRLNAFIDANNNGTQEANESNFPLGNFTYTINNGTVHNITSPNGTYTIYDNNANNTYDLNYSINASYAGMYSLTNSSYSNVHVITGAGLTTYNFPITIVQTYNDVAVYIIPLSAPRAGTTYKNKIVYTNLGNQTITTGIIQYTADAATTISTISQSGTVQTATGFQYTYANLMPFETRSMIVTLSVPPIPAVALNQLLTNTASITPDTNETVLNNNYATSTQGVIAAYDPNDKTESHGERILYSSFSANDYLYYTIRFENLGNASAIDVTITDELNNQIDESSVEMISASHNYILDRMGANLTWRFNNIQLPVSIAGSEIGKGFVTFRVRLRPGFAIGDVIPNTAAIYFDTNPPVITNTFNTEFVTALNNTSFETNAFTVFPNPANHTTQITVSDATDGITNVILFDLLGKMIKSNKVNGETLTTIDVSNLPKGVYLLSIETVNKTKAYKKLIIE
ncbi:T9SS type A sorting domain-containing protein [Flavobacterium buctense]|uniref:T9SS type A sorting domain-containing protein n=1 Tax=Flavobacterium buctense TaxID=1648146 RepID=A0ABU9DYP7_9FLAO|nr:T9SS type A sorting domain-containing protein [Flavobacterium buctense]